jgi:hypothetical protein
VGQHVSVTLAQGELECAVTDRQDSKPRP